MEIGGMSSSVLDSTYMNLKEEPASKYQAIFGKMPLKDSSYSNLEPSHLIISLITLPEDAVLLLM